jgi:hypothetical protein
LKKIFVLAAMIMAVFSCTAFAASGYGTKVVIIGGGEFKTADYYKIIQKNLGTKSSTKYECGNDIQKRFQVFMMNRYDIGEDKPRKQDMSDFAAWSGYGKVLFIFVDENIDTQTHGNHSQKNRSTIQMDAYLVTSSGISDFNTTSQEFTSKASNLRARRGAFEKCLKEIVISMHL